MLVVSGCPAKLWASPQATKAGRHTIPPSIDTASHFIFKAETDIVLSCRNERIPEPSSRKFEFKGLRWKRVGKWHYLERVLEMPGLWVIGVLTFGEEICWNYKQRSVLINKIHRERWECPGRNTTKLLLLSIGIADIPVMSESISMDLFFLKVYVSLLFQHFPPIHFLLTSFMGLHFHWSRLIQFLSTRKSFPFHTIWPSRMSGQICLGSASSEGVVTKSLAHQAHP